MGTCPRQTIPRPCRQCSTLNTAQATIFHSTSKPIDENCNWEIPFDDLPFVPTVKVLQVGGWTLWLVSQARRQALWVQNRIKGTMSIYNLPIHETRSYVEPDHYIDFLKESRGK